MTTGTNSGRLSSEAVLELWRSYRATGDAAARDRLVFTLAPIVKSIVYRKVREIPAHRDVDDFISCGLEALIRSIDRYDPEKGATLEQFAWTRIHGAVLDELRRFDWAPRSVRRLERELNRARERFIVLHGRAPSRSELATALAIGVDELDRLLADLERAEVDSLNTPVTGDDDSGTDRIDTVPSSYADADPERSAIRERALERFRAAFAQLAAREREVARLLYLDHLTLREASAILGISESRICQIHGKFKRELRALLGDDEQLLLELV